MKQERIIALADILAAQMNHWIFFSVAMTVGALLGVKTPPFDVWLICALLPVLFFFIRRYTNRFSVMAVSHFLCLAVLFYAPIANLFIKVPIILYGIGLVLYSFYLRLKKKERLDDEISPQVAIAILALSLLLLHYAEHTEFDRYYMGIAAFFLLCYYIRYYMLHYLHFLSVNTGSTGYIPRREIFMAGIRLTGIYVVPGIIVLLLISDITWLSWILEQLRNGIIWLREHGFFSWLASLFPEGEPPVNPPAGSIEPSFPAMPPGDDSPGLIWVILERIMFVAVPLLLFVLLCFGIRQFIKFFREQFRQRRSQLEVLSSESKGDIREKYEVKKEKGAKKDFFAFLSPTERIRRIYKQRVWEKREKLTPDGRGNDSQNANLLNTYTARECGSLLSEEQLANVYEKARYSGVKCTKEDIRKAKG